MGILKKRSTQNLRRLKGVACRSLLGRPGQPYIIPYVVYSIQESTCYEKRYTGIGYVQCKLYQQHTVMCITYSFIVYIYIINSVYTHIYIKQYTAIHLHTAKKPNQTGCSTAKKAMKNPRKSLTGCAMRKSPPNAYYIHIYISHIYHT